MAQITYTRSSDVSTKNVQSLILEIEIRDDNGKRGGGATVYRVNDEWKVSLNVNNVNSEIVTWEQFLEIFHKMVVFVSQENEILLKGEDK